MLLSDFHRLRIDAEDCANLEEYIYEEGGSLPEECYSADMSGDAPIKILTIIWELSRSFSASKVREISGLTQFEFARNYLIGKRTVEGWDMGETQPPEYALELLAADVVSAKIKEVMGEN